MHGFPDNLHIYDYLIPHLVARGRRVVAFDFLGFGEFDKPAGFFGSSFYPLSRARSKCFSAMSTVRTYL